MSDNKINEIGYSCIEFDDLETGDLFQYGVDYYMKVYGDEETLYNAVDLETGELLDFSLNTFVRGVKSLSISKEG